MRASFDAVFGDCCRCHSCRRFCYLCAERQLFGQAQNRFRNLSTAKRSTAKSMNYSWCWWLGYIEWSLRWLEWLGSMGIFSFRFVSFPFFWEGTGCIWSGHRSPSKGVSNEPRKKSLKASIARLTMANVAHDSTNRYEHAKTKQNKHETRFAHNQKEKTIAWQNTRAAFAHISISFRSVPNNQKSFLQNVAIWCVTHFYHKSIDWLFPHSLAHSLPLSQFS